MSQQEKLYPNSIRGWCLPALAANAILLTVAFGLRAAAAEKTPPRPRVIVDFEEATAVKLQPQQAAAVRVPADSGHALEIKTDASASWPGMRIEPRAGKWDLSGFDGVEMDVVNPQDVPVRVLLSINNPGADGRRNCNTEGVNVPARGKAVLSVPFGMWHGSPNHPLDLKNIESMTVLLDKPGRAHRFLVDNIRAVSYDDRSKMQAVFADPFFKQLKPAFGRGINLGNALEAPTEGAWGVVLKDLYFRQIKAAGFDSVRIPVRWSAHAGQTPHYRIDPKFFERVDWAVRQALDQKLVPVLNMHHYDEIFREPDKHAERFLAMWRQIAEHYKDYPSTLVLELLNEPNAKLTSDKWNKLLAEALAVVRRSNPTRDVVVGPVGWNSINDLPSLELPKDDRRLIVTVHYYSPFQFTHQGAGWAGPDAQKWLGTKWTGSKAEQRAVVRDFDKAIAWAVQHRRPIFLGEFGAFERADMESRARWTRFVADEALKRNMGFAYWEFCSGFGAYDPRGDQWIGPLKDALVPNR